MVRIPHLPVEPALLRTVKITIVEACNIDLITMFISVADEAVGSADVQTHPSTIDGLTVKWTSISLFITSDSSSILLKVVPLIIL